jgi:hypothetical protein
MSVIMWRRHPRPACGFTWTQSYPGSPGQNHWCGEPAGHGGSHVCAVPGCGATA